MARFFSRERFGQPQIIAGLMLLIFAAECAWLVAHTAPNLVSPEEFVRVQQGLEQWRGHGVAGTPSAAIEAFPELPPQREYNPDHPRPWYLIGAAPVALLHVTPYSPPWIWLTRAPYIIFGVLLGASVWYVSRRLYGNAGGYMALALYCFSPAVVRSSALWAAPPDIAGAWGAFGAVFTAIAVSHTLYAPREVVLWNWRRIALLGISLTLAAGSQFSLALIVPVLLAFMFYLAPGRRSAAATILGAACGVGLALLFAAYFFHSGIFWESLKHAELLPASTAALRMPGAYLQVLREISASGPVLTTLVPIALASYAFWPRCRYFGNTAPLLIALLFLALRVASPHEAGSVFCLIGVVFLFVFVAGIMADLLETRRRGPPAAGFFPLFSANPPWNLIGLARIG